MKVYFLFINFWDAVKPARGSFMLKNKVLLAKSMTLNGSFPDCLGNIDTYTPCSIVIDKN